jgi:hypothetical protein
MFFSEKMVFLPHYDKNRLQTHIWANPANAGDPGNGMGQRGRRISQPERNIQELPVSGNSIVFPDHIPVWFLSLFGYANYWLRTDQPHLLDGGNLARLFAYEGIS